MQYCLLVLFTIYTICMVLFGTHAATCDRVVLVLFVIGHCYLVLSNEIIEKFGTSGHLDIYLDIYLDTYTAVFIELLRN